ncbi:MAG TPA: acyl carrier protein [Acidobacteriaceae bacterium]|nr:acyl carrier protein [Acidobacteriaceae bacterium]
MSGIDEIRNFVQELLTRQDDRRPLADNDSLLMSGRLQSVDAVEIVLFLEERFGIDFAELGFDREQLDSIDTMAALVQNAGSRS